MKFNAKKWLTGIFDSGFIAQGIVIPLNNEFAFNYDPGGSGSGKYKLYFKNTDERLCWDTWTR